MDVLPGGIFLRVGARVSLPAPRKLLGVFLRKVVAHRLKWLTDSI